MNTTENLTAGLTRSQPPSPGKRLAAHWPAAVGLVFAAFVAFGAAADDLAPIVTASGFVYLGTASVGRRTAAWPMFFITFVIIGIATATGLGPVWPSWWMLAIAVLLVAYGLIRHVRRRPGELPVQAGAMLLLATLAIVAAQVSAFWAGLLVAAGLLAHTAWDVYHYRVQRVVSRSMAEFCAVLDTCLALVILAGTLSQAATS